MIVGSRPVEEFSPIPRYPADCFAGAMRNAFAQRRVGSGPLG